MRRGKTYEWIPFYVDKWIFGSTRIELDPAERSVWIDLMALASKDDGYIRANEATPYPVAQLAGMLCIAPELLTTTIDKCVQYGKLERRECGTLYLSSWGDYALTGRHKRRVMSEYPDMVVREPGPYTETDTNTKTNTETETKTDTANGFDTWWERYPRKIAKQDAVRAYAAEIREGATADELARALEGYRVELKTQGTEERFTKHPATFLRAGRWRDYLNGPPTMPPKRDDEPSDAFMRDPEYLRKVGRP